MLDALPFISFLVPETPLLLLPSAKLREPSESFWRLVTDNASAEVRLPTGPFGSARSIGATLDLPASTLPGSATGKPSITRGVLTGKYCNVAMLTVIWGRQNDETPPNESE